MEPLVSGTKWSNELGQRMIDVEICRPEKDTLMKKVVDTWWTVVGGALQG